MGCSGVGVHVHTPTHTGTHTRAHRDWAGARVLGTHRKLRINVRIDSYQGRIVASMDFSENESEKVSELTSAVVGKHAVYFEFLSEETGVIAEFDRFRFM